jgi:cytidylate kinase
VTAEAQGRDIPTAIAQEAALDDSDRVRGTAALVEDGYLTGSDVTSMADGGGRVYLVQGCTGKARRATRQWPAEHAYDDLVDLLEQRIARRVIRSRNRNSEPCSARSATSVGLC